MKRPLSHPAVVVALGLVLIALAALQYRWIGEISAAERERLERSLHASAERFRADFNQELSRLGERFWLDPRRPERFREEVAARFAAGGGDGVRLEAAYLSLGDEADETVERLRAGSRDYETVDHGNELPAWLRRLDRRGGQRRGRRVGPPDMGRPGSWLFLPRDGLLVTSLTRVEGLTGGEPPRIETVGTLYLKVDESSLREELFPRLEARHFGDAGPDEGRSVRVVSTGQTREVIYESATEDVDGPAVVEMPLFYSRDESAQEWARRARGRLTRRPPPEPPDEPGRDEGGRRSGFLESLMPFATVSVMGPGQEWMLRVGYRTGTLDAVVARARRRNLIVSTGILALLAAGMAVVLLSARRAQRLAQMQMEFVAGVSHELRTPLAVIRSAGENLAEGVVQDPDRVREYGAVVRDEGRRLTEMVEQTLGFAGAQAGRRPVEVSEREAAETLRAVVAEPVADVERDGCTVEVDIPAELPVVRVDVEGLRLCLRNLIQNAAKYGGEARWIGVSARVMDGGVAVQVRDRGPGVDAPDLAHLFEPFYRGRRAMDQQIRGAGLGLSLAKDAMESFGGRLRVRREESEETVFTAWIPLVESSK